MHLQCQKSPGKSREEWHAFKLRCSQYEASSSLTELLVTLITRIQDEAERMGGITQTCPKLRPRIGLTINPDTGGAESIGGLCHLQHKSFTSAFKVVPEGAKAWSSYTFPRRAHPESDTHHISSARTQRLTTIRVQKSSESP